MTTLDELRWLERDATPGEWRPDGSHVYGPKDSRSAYKNGRQLVATATDLPFSRQESFAPHNADAALIAAARNALPALLRVAEAATDMLRAKDDNDPIAMVWQIAMVRAALAALEATREH